MDDNFELFSDPEELEEVFGGMGSKRGDFYRILFWERSSLPATVFPVILLGGWADDDLCQDTHHIQRILIRNQPPPANTGRLFMFSRFPFGKLQSLNLVHYRPVHTEPGVIGNVIMKIGREFPANQWYLEYPASKEDIAVVPLPLLLSKNRFERFDLFGAAWLFDGRIFVNEDNLDLVGKMMQLCAFLTALKAKYDRLRWVSLRQHLRERLLEKIKGFSIIHNN